MHRGSVAESPVPPATDRAQRYGMSIAATNYRLDITVDLQCLAQMHREGTLAQQSNLHEPRNPPQLKRAVDSSSSSFDGKRQASNQMSNSCSLHRTAHHSAYARGPTAHDTCIRTGSTRSSLRRITISVTLPYTQALRFFHVGSEKRFGTATAPEPSPVEPLPEIQAYDSHVCVNPGTYIPPFPSHAIMARDEA